MSRRSAMAAIVLLAAMAMGPARAQDAPDPAAGRRLATNVCSTCHVVAPDQMAPFLNQPAPSFTAIANRPSFDPATLRTFLTGSHATLGASGMPNPRLSDRQIDNVVVYLQSLRTRR